MEGVNAENAEAQSVTLLVMRSFSILPGASRACVGLRDPTEVFQDNSANHFCIDQAMAGSIIAMENEV